MKNYLKPDFRMLDLNIESGYAVSTAGNTLPSVGDDWTNNEFE